MKVKVLSRDLTQHVRATKEEIHPVARNVDPALHPFEAPREYKVTHDTKALPIFLFFIHFFAYSLSIYCCLSLLFLCFFFTRFLLQFLISVFLSFYLLLSFLTFNFFALSSSFYPNLSSVGFVCRALPHIWMAGAACAERYEAEQSVCQAICDGAGWTFRWC